MSLSICRSSLSFAARACIYLLYWNWKMVLSYILLLHRGRAAVRSSADLWMVDRRWRLEGGTPDALSARTSFHLPAVIVVTVTWWHPRRTSWRRMPDADTSIVDGVDDRCDVCSTGVARTATPDASDRRALAAMLYMEDVQAAFLTDQTTSGGCDGHGVLAYLHLLLWHCQSRIVKNAMPRATTTPAGHDDERWWWWWDVVVDDLTDGFCMALVFCCAVPFAHRAPACLCTLRTVQSVEYIDVMWLFGTSFCTSSVLLFVILVSAARMICRRLLDALRAFRREFSPTTKYLCVPTGGNWRRGSAESEFVSAATCLGLGWPVLFFIVVVSLHPPIWATSNVRRGIDGLLEQDVIPRLPWPTQCRRRLGLRD